MYGNMDMLKAGAGLGFPWVFPAHGFKSPYYFLWQMRPNQPDSSKTILGAGVQRARAERTDLQRRDVRNLDERVLGTQRTH